MILEATQSKIDILTINRINITYTLTTDGEFFGIECYRDGADSSNPRNYASIRRLTTNRQEAEECLRELIENNVFPVHLKDIIDDRFEI